MATILKCKMCGGDISINSDMTVGTCQYCGSIMTLPKVDSEKKARLFNHANQYRLNCEFDKAFDAYRMISEEDEQEPEAYWGMLLSEYGVEYVEDPKTKKRIPTCHRTIIKPVKNNTHYELAYRYADTESKLIYQDEAEVIDRIQRKIAAISAKEDPYDVFICYKETDDATRERTTDSVLAQEIYDELIKQGIRTFFARITLSDKLGEDYEPYIYSALKTAKVMLVIGTSNENTSSVWVRNEWMRFIQFMAEDDSKTLIPVYKEMDAYALPEELSKFQGQDFGKVGALQDLVYSVKKIVSREEQAEQNDVLNNLIKERLEKEKKQKEWEIKKSKASETAKRVIPKAMLAIGAGVVCVLLVFGIITFRKVSEEKKAYQEKVTKEYEEVKSFAENGQYERAYGTITDEAYFLEKDPDLYNYLQAMHLFTFSSYEESKALFEKAGNYANSEEYVEKCEYYLLLENLNYSSIDEQEHLLETYIQQLGLEADEAQQKVFVVRFEGLLNEQKYKEASECIDEFRRVDEAFVKEYASKRQIAWYNDALELLDNDFENDNNRATASYLLKCCTPTYLNANDLSECLDGNINIVNLIEMTFDNKYSSIKDYLLRLIWLSKDQWLVGTWKSSDGYFFSYDVDNNGVENSSYNLPAFDEENIYFYIGLDGIYYIYNQSDTSKPPETQRRMFKFVINNSRTLTVRCFKENKEYITLTRQ